MEKRDYAGMIRAARKANGLSQEELAARVGISRNAVAGWETGHSRPDLDLIPKLCLALRLSPVRFFGLREGRVSELERRAAALFSSLEADDQQVMIWQMEAVADRRHAQRLQETQRKLIQIFRSNLAAAAGFGGTLEASSGERVYLLRDPLTEQADEIITVSGRSMEPTFHDGDQLLVQHASEIRPGELGVFLVDDEGYVKEYQPDGLHSHNPEYPVISLKNHEQIRCIGRVLGKVQPEQIPDEAQIKLMQDVRASSVR